MTTATRRVSMPRSWLRAFQRLRTNNAAPTIIGSDSATWRPENRSSKREGRTTADCPGLSARRVVNRKAGGSPRRNAATTQKTAVTSTTRPSSRSTRAEAAVEKNIASTFSRIVRRQCASVMRVSGTSSGGQMPAFPTNRSSPPRNATACCTRRSASPRSPKSAAIAVARRPIDSMSATTAAASAARARYPTTTSAPQRARSRAVAAPMPREPPVTSATLPSSLQNPSDTMAALP